MSILRIAKLHCSVKRPALTLKAHVQDRYGVSYGYLVLVECGARRPSPKLLARLAQEHTRLFPSEPLPPELTQSTN